MNINTKPVLAEFSLVGTNKRRVHYRFISSRVTVHETCDAKVLKEWNITLYKI